MVTKKKGVRAIPISGVSVTGVMIDLPYESTLERDLVTTLMFEHGVTTMTAQPVKIEFVDDAGKTRRYTPDYLIGFEHRPHLLCEVKYQKDLDKDALELKQKFKGATAYCEKLGWEFDIFNEHRIRTPKLYNVQFLWRHYVESQKPLHVDAGEILGAFERRNGRPATQTEIVAELYPDPMRRSKAVWLWWQMLVRNVLQCDLDAPITPRTLYWPAAAERP